MDSRRPTRFRDRRSDRTISFCRGALNRHCPNRADELRRRHHGESGFVPARHSRDKMVIGVNRRGVSVASDVKDQTGDEQRRCAQHYPQPVTD
jgi:hypothetical protein